MVDPHRRRRAIGRGSCIVALSLVMACSGEPGLGVGPPGAQGDRPARREGTQRRRPKRRSPRCSSPASRSRTPRSGPISTAANYRRPRPGTMSMFRSTNRATTRCLRATSPRKGYVVDKIHDFKVVVNDPGRSLADRRIALRFLVHFIEDLHMPLHVGDNDDKGGNRTQVRFFDQGTNMHSLWDSGMIEHVSADRRCLAGRPGRARHAGLDARPREGTIEDWATESLLAARQAYQVPETGKRLKSGQKLADAYLKANLPALRGRLYHASARLAWVLNDAFPAN